MSGLSIRPSRYIPRIRFRPDLPVLQTDYPLDGGIPMEPTDEHLTFALTADQIERIAAGLLDQYGPASTEPNSTMWCLGSSRMFQGWRRCRTGTCRGCWRRCGWCTAGIGRYCRRIDSPMARCHARKPLVLRAYIHVRWVEQITSGDDR